MDILMLSASLSSGGAETHICELALALAKRGNKVCVATSGGRLANSLSAAGVTHLKMPLNSKDPLSLIISIKRLSRLLKSETFDIIHVHSRIAALVCRIVTRKYSIPIVSTVHSHFKTGFLLRRLSFWGSRAIAVGEDLKGYLSSEYGFNKSKITVIPNGIDTERFSPSQSFRKRKYKKIIFVSRLDADCSLGAILLCKTAERLAKRFPKIKIDIVGGGSERKKLLSLSQKINYRLGYPCITICGHISDMPPKLREADVFVGVSRAALEAMASGIPTVLCGNEGFIGVLDASTIFEAASTNFCCRGSELPTSESLYGALSTLLEMKDTGRRELGAYLREYVEKNNSLSALAERTENFYRSAISDKEDIAPQKILLCGYYGFGNIGDEAMLLEMIKKLKAKYPDAELSVITHSPRKYRRALSVRCISRRNPVSMCRVLAECDRLIFGGGSVLQDKSSIRSLIWYCSLIDYAYKKGARIELASNGLGPLRKKLSKRLAARALGRCAKISFRDPDSAELAKGLGVSTEKISFEDELTSAIPACDSERTQRILKELGLCHKSFAVIGINGKIKRKMLKNIKENINQLKNSGLLPLFIAMHPKEDRRLCKKLSKKYGSVYIDKISPSELRGIISKAAIVLGTRYHLLYFAKLEEVELLGFGDDPKILSLSKKR